MKRLSLSLLLGGVFLVATAPATSASIPGCFGKFMPDLLSNHPIPETIGVGNDADANADGVFCYKVLDR